MRAALAVSMALMATTALDEYVPYLVEAVGVAAVSVPLLVLVVSAGDVVGGWFAGRGVRWLGAGVGLSGVCLAGGALVGRVEGLVLVGVAFGLLRWAMAAADARLQGRIGDGARATVTSLAGVGSEALSVLVFAGYAVGSVWWGPGVLFGVAGVPLVVLAVVLWRPSRSGPG